MSVASSGVEVRVAAASIEAEGKKKKDLKATLLSPSSQAQALTSSCSGLFPPSTPLENVDMFLTNT